MKTRSIFLIFVSVLLVCTPGLAHKGHKDQVSKIASTQMAARDLWVDHIFWIRSLVMAKARNDKTAQVEADKQAVDNAKKIAGVIEPFYGKAASKQLFGLLAGHYGAVKDYMTATIPARKGSKQKSASKKLISNALEIATFLSQANPNLPKETLVALLNAHGGHHMTQIKQIQKSDFSGEAKTWAAMKTHMYTLSDALVAGIAKQFPKKF